MYAQSSCAPQDFDPCCAFYVRSNNEQCSLSYQQEPSSNVVIVGGPANTHSGMPDTCTTRSVILAMMKAHSLNMPYSRSSRSSRKLSRERKRYKTRDTEIWMRIAGDKHIKIGSELGDKEYACFRDNCAGISFGRPYELGRHYGEKHAEDRTSFWCPVPNCKHSKCKGDKPFNRKGGLKAHEKRVHKRR